MKRTAGRIGRAGLALLAVGLLASQAFAQTPIINLHNNTSSGVPAAPYTVGTAVTIRGVATVGVGTFTAEYTDVYVQDATAGVMVYKAGAPPYAFQIGDSVTIAGTIAQYRGMTEVSMNTYTVHATGLPERTPLVVTCYNVEHTFLANYTEPNEGRLVRLNNVTWSGAWPSFSGAVTLQDETGTCTLFIDGTTGIQGMTPPAGAFDVIGVIKQYAGYSPPYTTDYELMPRSADDFILHPGPQFVDGPRETDIQSDQVTIHLETDTECTVTIEYGETTGYELGTATDGGSGTTHDVVITGLDPATIYHYRVTAEDIYDATVSPDKLFCSASAAGCTGTITALFNKTVDHSLATWEEAIGGQTFTGWIVDRINASDYSIDVAIYSFDISAVADALIAAFNRGLRVRFVYDYESGQSYQTQVTRLVNAGITVIDDAYGANDGSEIMHHKLWVFDALSADPADPWVVTGSWNLTTQQTNTDAQNVIMIQDQALAQVCTAEFDEMWGSNTAVPNASLSRFGTNKLDDTPKLFNVGGKLVEMYFAPSDPWIQGINQQVMAADFSIHFCIMSFTRFDLCNEMEDRWMNVPGMEVRGVFDSGESGNTSSQYFPMHGELEYAWNPAADVWLDAETGILHHKYMIIDVNRSGTDPTVVTGSANWSNNAVDENDENVIIVHDAITANCYFQEFAARYTNAGGTGFLAAGIDAGGRDDRLLLVDPNPAISSVQALFSLGTGGRVVCDLYSVDGRKVSRLLDRVLTPGTHMVRWEEGRDEPLASGAYFLHLQTPEGNLTRRVTVVR
ncbi:MAG: phospholipase D-like domain-containing protein [Candidatus Eisenbacteria bacterium]